MPPMVNQGMLMQPYIVENGSSVWSRVPTAPLVRQVITDTARITAMLVKVIDTGTAPHSPADSQLLFSR